MQHVTMRNFNVAEAARHSQRLQLSLAEPFFADLEQTEVDGGEVEACIDVKHISQDLYHIDVSLKGSVTVACDRCLDPLTLPVEVEETLKVKDEAPAASDHEDTLYTDYRTGCIDLALRTHRNGAAHATHPPDRGMQPRHAQPPCLRSLTPQASKPAQHTGKATQPTLEYKHPKRINNNGTS